MDNLEMYDDRVDKRPISPNRLTFSKFVVLISILVILTGLIIVTGRIKVAHSPSPDIITPPTSGTPQLSRSTSEADFKAYLESAQQAFSSGFVTTLSNRALPEFSADVAQGQVAAPGTNPQPTPSRVSTTNVQVTGIDEPDILKTDGQHIYYAGQNYFYPTMRDDLMLFSDPGIESLDQITPIENIRVAPPLPSQTTILKAFPPADLKDIGGIEQVGDLLLTGNTLLIFTYDHLYAYDVTTPTAPTQTWKLKYENNTSLVSARLQNNQVYLITQTHVNTGTPCPLPLLSGISQLTLPCTDIYHPTTPIPADSTYTVMKLNPQTGAISNQTAFLGTTGSSVIYMSPESLYITYSYSGDVLAVLTDFITTNTDLFPQTIRDRIAKLATYDISQTSKLNELETILNAHTQSLSSDDQLKYQTELTNRLQTYISSQKRNLERTGIAKLNLADLQIIATGDIPGTPLNQFSLDEYQGHLRIATTIGENNPLMWRFGTGSNNPSANDVYILDAALRQTGSILDLGLTERIYSARFIGNRGYLVTFRQIDPFYILDLSRPTAPQKTGELKIPGYSSYLHPLTDTDNLILGVGQEGSQVKLSLFNVLDATNPIESDKYILTDGWTDVSTTHHAFLHDPKHQIFFMPAGSNGYIFSYINGQLELVKAIAGIQARRALFINDYLYIVGDSQIVVLNQLDWTEVRRLDL